MAPGHPREGGGGQETGTKVGVFPPMLCYMAITPAVRQGPVRLGLGGLKGSGQSSPSSCAPTLQTTTWWKKKKEKKEQGRRREITISSEREKKSWILSPYSQFPIALPPSFPALICIPRGTSSTSCLLVKHSINIKNSQEKIGRSPTP